MFVSADPPNFEPYYGEEEEEEEEGVIEEEEKDVGQGDIYHVLDDGYILDLNKYRGLQVIDARSASDARIVGTLPICAFPVEMHVIGDRAVVLLNEWPMYDQDVQDLPGRAAILLIDIADRANPSIIGRLPLPETEIVTSRLTDRGETQVLYVASRVTSSFGQSRIKSIVVRDHTIVERDEISLPGWLWTMRAQNDVLMVSNNIPTQERWDVRLIDISDPRGGMVLGGSAPVNAPVRSLFNMDFRRNQLRVFSGPAFPYAGAINRLQTWNASDLHNVVLVDQEPFGTSNGLNEAFIFDDRAFAVTYDATDPLHAFTINEDGRIEPADELVAPGRDGYLVPVLNESRLLGIGTGDTIDNLTLSLYDITNPHNPAPLVTRVVTDVAAGWPRGSTNSTWKHHAFMVREDAVRVQSPTGEIETGLALVPVANYRVQVVTFSSSTITSRGLMQHDTPVRRTFLAGSDLAGALSDASLSLHDRDDPNAPVARGHVTLAAHAQEIFAFGNYRVRLEGAWEGDALQDDAWKVDVLPGTGLVNTAEPVASFEVPKYAQLYKAGDRLVALTRRPVDGTPQGYETTIDVFDLSNPAVPRPGSRLVTTDLAESPIYTTDRAIVFLQHHVQRVGLGTDTRCKQYPPHSECRGESGCAYLLGQRFCHQPEGAPAWCHGGFAQCQGTEEEGFCVPVATEQIAEQLHEVCEDVEAEREWRQFELRAVDLSDIMQLTVAAPIVMPADEEGIRVLASGTDLHVVTRRPLTIADDPRPHVQYFVTRIDMSNPSQPVAAPAVNVPGEIIRVDGARFTARDMVWTDTFAETALAQFEIVDGGVHLRAYRRLANWHVDRVSATTQGRVAVSHQRIWPDTWSSQRRSISVLAPSSLPSMTTDVPGFEVLFESSPLPFLVRLNRMIGDRLFLWDSGNVLVYSLADPARPQVQAYFPTDRHGISDFVIHGNDILFRSYRYGVHQIGLDMLQQPPP